MLQAVNSSTAGFDKKAEWPTLVETGHCAFDMSRYLFSPKATDMRKAIIEVLGAVFANAPLSDDAQGRRSRQIVFAIVVLLFLVAMVALTWR